MVAGEASGDGHGAGLVRALRARHPDARFFGMGGPQLGAAGVELNHASSEISVMGFVEVLPKLPRLFGVLAHLAALAAERRPACAILIDVPDFNLRLAKRLKALGIPVVYYVSPMVWAWRRGRIRTIARRVDLMLCILPFEPEVYAGSGVDARYVGHPTVEQIGSPMEATDARRALGLAEHGRVLGLLPGSREGEIRRILPTLAETAARLCASNPGLRVAVPVAPGIDKAQVEAAFRARNVDAQLFDGRAREVISSSDVVLVASGTATLETALLNRPMVVVYRVSPLTWALGRALVKLPAVSLVNLLVGRSAVPELLQAGFTPEAAAAHVARLWEGADRAAQLGAFEAVRARLGSGSASHAAAGAVLELVAARGT